MNHHHYRAPLGHVEKSQGGRPLPQRWPSPPSEVASSSGGAAWSSISLRLSALRPRSHPELICDSQF